MDADRAGMVAFTKQDLKAHWNDQNVSIYQITRDSPERYPDKIDVIDAFCFSELKWKERVVAYYQLVTHIKVARIEN